MVIAVVDNDVLFKGAAYGLLFELIGTIPAEISELGVLGAARFVAPAALRNANLTSDPDVAQQLLQDVLERVVILEPTDNEIIFAAELEVAAQNANLNLDAGESQLCAIVLVRSLLWLATGDKRAITAFEALLETGAGLEDLRGKVLCLEQLFLVLISTTDAASIRDAVCAEVSVDLALAICFSCNSPVVNPLSWSEGLRSYIDDLRRDAPNVLAKWGI